MVSNRIVLLLLVILTISIFAIERDLEGKKLLYVIFVEQIYGIKNQFVVQSLINYDGL